MTQHSLKKDRESLQHAMEAVIRSARQQKQGQRSEKHAAAEPQVLRPGAKLPEPIAELVFDISGHRRLDDLVLPEAVREGVLEFMFEYSQASLLREHSIEPRHTLLLVGPPGNGKTSLAEAISVELGLPLLSVRYDSLVDSFLGETANRLRKLIDYASINQCVLFFDEFDAIGKERGDIQETGEIKRVVSSLLVHLDRLPAHSIVVCATNHPELLDRAVWRRFQLKLELPVPSVQELQVWFNKFKASLGGSVGITAKEFVNCMAGESMSEIESFTLDVRRKVILSKGGLEPAEAVKEVLSRWQTRLRQDVLRHDGTNLSTSSAVQRGKKPASDNRRKREAPPKPDLLSGASEDA